MNKDKGLDLINVNRKISSYEFVTKEELRELRTYKRDIEFLLKMVEIFFGITFYTCIGFWLAWFILK